MCTECYVSQFVLLKKVIISTFFYFHVHAVQIFTSYLKIADCRTQIQIVSLIHEDTLLNRHQSLKHIRHLCRVWVQVGDDSLIVTLRKTSGKIQVQVNQY